MSVAEILPALQGMSRADKLRVMSFLAQELSEGEDDMLEAGVCYPVWSPYDAHAAADAMLSVLQGADVVTHEGR